MRRSGSFVRVLPLVALAAGLAVGCEPVPARAHFVVTSSAFAPDAHPGDGTCATSGGQCTLIAALQEGDLASAGADLTVPAATYSIEATIHGDVRINWDAPAAVELRGGLSTAAGGRLGIDGINPASPTPPAVGWSFVVTSAGEAQVRRSAISQLFVSAGGVAVVDRSVVVDGTDGEVTVTNRGVLIGVDATLAGFPRPGVPVLDSEGGIALFRSTVIATTSVVANGAVFGTGGTGTCAGSPITSYGRLHIEVPCAAATSATGGSAGITAEVTAFSFSPFIIMFRLVLDPTSPLVDAIPLDDPRCQPGTTDLFGTPRGVDGNGDGTGGCDIGAIERPAA